MTSCIEEILHVLHIYGSMCILWAWVVVIAKCQSQCNSICCSEVCCQQHVQSVKRSHAAIQWTLTHQQPQFPNFKQHCITSLSHQVSGRGGNHFVSHAHELRPVATETSGIGASVHDESPVGAASGFLSQADAGFALGHVVADVDELYRQQVKQPARHDAAVPRTGEAKSSAGTQTRTEVVNSFLFYQQKGFIFMLSHFQR